MNTTITARSITINDAFRERIERKLTKFDRFFDDDARAIVTVTNEGGRVTVEITILAGGMFYRSEKTTNDKFDSLEAVCDLLFKQIVRNKSKLEKKLKRNAFDPAYQDGPVLDEDYKVVRIKKFPIKPMTVDEAILQMNLLDHEFYMFRNSEDGEINLVYKRDNGDYGLITPQND